MDFQIPKGRLASQPPDQNLKFERADWTSFRTVEGLQQKAGVAAGKLRRLVMKELTDNGFDAGGSVNVGRLPDGGGYFVEDDGDGIDGTPEDIARLFSIARPMVSTKLLRLPTRGALGNGLRVVAGAVLAGEGFLAVITRNRRIELRPERDGTTTVVTVTPVDFPVGTRIEIGFGPAIPEDANALFWAVVATEMARGQSYAGKSSPYWYDAPQFHELLSASGNVPVRELVASLDGCTGGRAGEIVAEAGLVRIACNALSREQADTLLKVARKYAREVTPKRLGAVGPDLFPDRAYAASSGEVSFGISPNAAIPFVVEVWAADSADMRLIACVNRTPVTGDVYAVHNRQKINLFGCGLRHTMAEAPKDKNFTILLNITTPYMPITSDGKEPNLEPFFDGISNAVAKAVRKARRPDAKTEEVVLDNLLPKRRRGRQSEAATIEYEEQVARFCSLILQIKSRLDLAVGSRSWCYLLEDYGLRKGEFDAAERLITECRKSGALPLDICAEDDARKVVGLERLDDPDIEREAARLIDYINNAHKTHMPISFWDDLDVYVEVAVEKLDLRNLFEPVCAEFHVPVQNFKGWSDLNLRAAMMRRFAEHEAAGRLCVLLLCGDHDPGGLHITDKVRKNLSDLSGAVGWTPENLIISRFGLNADFIDAHGLTWIDNLETSSGGQLDDPEHSDHDKRYVKDYIQQFGVRKCEANTLVKVPEIGRELCRDAILEFVLAEAPARYQLKLDREQAKLREAIRRQMGAAR
ncbi:hypothetical protein [Bradyrhizobium sp. URHD0069]|uniref:hypothetical protein n=1 Tax=Bradyrhizobium sp. URHD0069 TaxID=1380355 RepID=UPI000689375F|nr:hypothetical protein [Bradyrhizobium sp. URHD0069]